MSIMEHPHSATGAAADVAGDLKQWLDAFRAEHGRPPRVLHVGNIANNAYNNAKLLREAGLDCDVLCHDYYHIMGCPEWEDADFDTAPRDHFRPQWKEVDLHGYRRPAWFAQGPLWSSLRYLIARREGRAWRAKFFWRCLQWANGTRDRDAASRGWHGPAAALTWLRRAAMPAKPVLLPCWLTMRRMARLARRLCSPRQNRFFTWDCLALAVLTLAFVLGRSSGAAWLLAASVAAWIAMRTCRMLWWRAGPHCEPPWDEFDERAAELIAQFDRAFPGRADRLAKADLSPYRNMLPLWKRLLAHYDVVQAYATSPIWPLLAGKTPYVGFEHGTLRTFTLEDTPLCRTTALAYRMADHVFITNGDCVDYARKIGVTRMSPMLHPVNDRAVRAVAGAGRQVHDELQARWLFLCTLRHDWEIKGTEKYIRAIPAIRARLGDDFRVIMTEWGRQVEESKALAESLGVTRFLHWIDPLPRRRLLRLLKSVDVLFDQIALPHFGATAPEGVAAGVPVIMSYDPASTRWIVSEPAPILSAWTVEEIAAQVAIAVQPAWREDYRRRSQQWIDACHNTEIIVRSHLEVYRGLLGDARLWQARMPALPSAGRISLR